MLADKDRIFTNLYGFGDWGLEGARARGAWDNTKALIAALREGKPPPPGSTIGRQTSAPDGGPTTLLFAPENG